jgi:hypothetical protein
MNYIYYNGGYKYQLKEIYKVSIDIKPEITIKTAYIKLDTKGSLTIIKGYAWDGPSGPTIDTLTFMRGSLIHDALYQLMREKHLDQKYRINADRILRKICIEDRMCRLRAYWVYYAVRLFAETAADPASRRPVIKAPE